ncbi:MAG: transposase [Bacteroidetes bacterium]|nr:transposase [Bacteroidota bacterium]
MTKQTRRKFSADFKTKVALEATKNQKTLAQLSQQFGVNAIPISKWKGEFLENMAAVFSGNNSAGNEQGSAEIEKLYAQIGQLKVKNDFLKKSARKLGWSGTDWK